MKEIQQGDLCWLNFGSAPGSAPFSEHPCVVVPSDVFNRSRIATTVVCLITSNMDRVAGDTRLLKPSVVNVSQAPSIVKSIAAGLRLVFEGDLN